MGRLLEPPAVLELYSDLGGGKTTFVRGLARGLGSKDIVTSPTFTLNQIYKGKNGTKISHHDFYRLEEPGILADELAESLNDDKTVTVVEWGDIIKDVLPADRIRVEFKPLVDDSTERQITLIYPETASGLVKKLETAWTKIEP